MIVYLVQVCTRIGSYPLNYFHVLNKHLTNSVDFSLVSTIWPARAERDVDQTVSPDRVKTCALRVYTGYLPASNEAIQIILGNYSRLSVGKTSSLVPESRCLEKFSSKYVGMIGVDDILG